MATGWLEILLNHTLNSRPNLWIGRAEDKLGFFYLSSKRRGNTNTKSSTIQYSSKSITNFQLVLKGNQPFLQQYSVKSKREKTDIEYVQTVAFIHHFLILNEFTILTDGYFNPLQVILKLWFVLSLFQILHYQLSGHEEKVRIHTNICCHDLFIFSAIPFA